MAYQYHMLNFDISNKKSDGEFIYTLFAISSPLTINDRTYCTLSNEMWFVLSQQTDCINYTKQ